jgi:hypothetical protein
MTRTTPLEIKVVYDASLGRRRAGAVSLTRYRKSSRTALMLLFGAANLSVAACAYYVTWWKVDPFMNVTLFMRTPLTGVKLSDVSRAIVPDPANRSATEPASTPTPSDADSSPVTFSPQTTQVILGSTKYAWLTLATVSACALAAAGGALLGSARIDMFRRMGIILFLGALLVLSYVGGSTWNEYGWQFPTRTVRYGMAGVVVLGAALGLVLSTRARLFCRLGTITTLIAALGTVAGLYLGHLAGAIPSSQISASYLATAFMIHSSWALVLWPLTSIWAR